MRIKSFSAKILSAVLAVALLVSSVFVGGVSFASASTGTPATGYFTVGGTAFDATIEETGLRFAPYGKAEEKEGKWVAEGQFKNKIAINDFEMAFKLLDGVSAVEFVFETDAFIKTNDAVKNTVRVDSTGAVKINGKDATPATEDGYNKLSLSVSTAGVLSCNGKVDDEKRVECDDKTMATVSVIVEYAGTDKPTAGGVDFAYIDQSVSDTIDHKNDFTVNGDKVQFIIDINPSTTGAKAIYENGVTKLFVYEDTEYTIKYNAYRLTGGSPSAKLIASTDNTLTTLSINESEKKVVFAENNESSAEKYKISIAMSGSDSTPLSNIEVTVNASEQCYDDATKELNAPKLSNDTVALNSFMSKLEEATKTEYEVNDETITASIRVGSGKYLDIPTMESMVSDDTHYSKLTKTVYYMNVDTDTKFSTYSGMKVPVKTAGDYIFFVIFEDMFGNKLSTDKFYTEENGVITLTTDANYAPFIFEFTLEDNAPMSVKEGKQSTWYKGVKNTAAAFTIEASDDRTVEYKLYYKNGNEWVEIKQYTDEAAEYGYFSAEDTEAMAYDGTLTFTPIKTGTYRFKCTVSLKNFSGTEVAFTEIVVEDVTTVKPDDHFFENNIGSFIFLGIGTLALAGVIVLLCIKPKEEN